MATKPKARLVPLSKAFYHACSICEQRCECWSRRPKLTSLVISDVKPLIYILQFSICDCLIEVKYTSFYTLAEFKNIFVEFTYNLCTYCTIAPFHTVPSIMCYILLYRTTVYHTILHHRYSAISSPIIPYCTIPNGTVLTEPYHIVAYIF